MIRLITSSVNLIFFQLILSCSVENPKNSISLKSENSFRGKVISLDSNNSTVRVEVLARSNDLAPKFPNGIGSEHTMQVQPGDFALLSKTPIFRGKLQETFSSSEGKTFLLHNIWPDDPADKIRVNNVNRLLRRNTLSMGDSMIRTIGDNLPPFALYDQNGEIVTTDFFDGSVTVLNFIFSRCSVADMCPAATMKMKKLQDLALKTQIPHIQFLSITLDPSFDSPGVLKSYARGYNLNEDNFKICTANKSVIDDLTRQFGILRENKKDQPLDHTMRTIIINSKRQIIYQVPGRSWRVEDFLSRLQDGSSVNH
jgi:protein SCO1/2